MNKSERINDMIIYLNNKNFFNLSDLMEKYNISRSTALRDIKSLESLGMPIFSEHGRYGRYGILKNRLLSPIIFTVDEMYSMYFAMLTLQGYQSTPFYLDFLKLKKKFESCISEEHKNNLYKMKNVFRFASTNQIVDSIFLKDILHSAINNHVNDITYMRSNAYYSYTVQFINISSSFGQWYVTAYNYDSAKLQVFRCDKIISLSTNENKQSIDIKKIEALLEVNFKNEDSTDFEIEITNKGVDIFLKENYPSMELIYDNEKPIIKGYYNQKEENFISNYFISYGKEIISIKPLELKNIIKEKMKENLDYFNRI
ncbi:helix-turn-helix transcriptional regulator [Peptostreptococcus faecalis]|uniref:helix-turn-helix transcriptional regulator n=1 Tax=Peptostreptococcus faecalis TaxID=2045015 RepID=UPI000C797BA6|nr:WYL domain-containing protein [Peptostreptococcus faecalis]